MILAFHFAEALGPVPAIERLGGHLDHDSDGISREGPSGPLPHDGLELSLQSSGMGRGSTLLVIAALAAALGACTSRSTNEATDEDYLGALTSICTDTTEQLDSLPEPPEQISLANFATEASNALAGEAERVRRLEPPDELADDHRAFIRNTDEQATTWNELGSLPSADAETLEPLVTTIGQLTLGRNDLALEMGAPECQRSPG
jgi:hypothetical protein